MPSTRCVPHCGVALSMSKDQESYRAVEDLAIFDVQYVRITRKFIKAANQRPDGLLPLLPCLPGSGVVAAWI